MKHWQTYIQKQKPEYLQTVFPNDVAADMVVVIPCFNEPDIFDTLYSLLKCSRPAANILVATVFNSSVRSDENGILQNRASYEQYNRFAERYSTPDFRFFSLLFENLPRKHAGVGLARKIGMDLAVAHFLRNGKTNGIIVSLDADCTVSENYLSEISDAFRRDEKRNVTIHNFRHRAENNDTVIEKAAREYENYIHYFRNKLKYIGFPYYYHTIGSAFAVSADAYVRVGGMGRQQDGEDFYFLQKAFALGGATELTDVYVYPMARFSDRVPFGTGPALQKIIDEPDGRMKVYSEHSFRELKCFFDVKDAFFKADTAGIQSKITELHPSVVHFLENNDFWVEIADCNQNSATLTTFQKRFFHHFNAFKIIKFLNFAHPTYFEKEALDNHEI